MNTRIILVSCILVVFGIVSGADQLNMDDVAVNGMTITVKAQTISVKPLTLTPGKQDIVLKSGQPGWRGPVYTAGTSWRFRAMTEGSLKASLDGTPLVEGKDYLVNYDWGTVGAPEGSSVSGQKITIEYTYTSSRVDLAVEQGGKIQLIEGTPDSRKPLLPETPAGSTALFSVYLAHNTAELEPGNINIMVPGTKPYGDHTGREFITAALEKLAAGEAFTFAFLGDSITAQTDPEGGGFVERFRDWAEKKYGNVKYVRMEKGKKGTPVSPEKGEVAIVMAGVGGDDTPRGLTRLDDHVLVHAPDLVFIMFGVNDENRRGETNVVPPDNYEANLATLVNRIRSGGSEPVIMTTSMKNLGWSATLGNLDEHARRARKVAREQKVCLIDHFKAWEDLPKRGYNYMIPLGSCINHPNDLGHEMFFQGIRALIEGE